MTALALGVLASLAVSRLLGVRGRWPWRVVDLVAPPHDRPTPPLRRRRPDRGSRWTAPHRHRHARAASSYRSLERDLPDTVDLLRLAVSAGHSLHTAVVEVAATGTGPVADALAGAVDRFRRGGRLVEELERLPTVVGPGIRPLTTTLVVAASSGTPLGPALQRLADIERRRLRRRTEERVRRLPVLLLAPLLGLILPAFVLLTVVPVGLTTARVGLQPVADRARDFPGTIEPPRSPP